MHQFFKSTFFNFETVRLLGTCPYGGSDIAECLDAIGQIKNDDPVSWHRAWHERAERAEAIADEAKRNGHRVAARQAYLRASNYYRASAYMFNDRPQSPDARVLATAEKVITVFQQAITLLDGQVRILEIPYESYRLPGYLYLPPASKRLPGKIPILINSGGADSIQEELYYMHPAAGPELGYAVVTFEGPGQGIVLRRDRLYMRPDWETVVSRVVDHIVNFSTEHPELELDVDRLAIAGASMGGYFALRGASDPRIKACVAIDPFYDMWDFATAHISPAFIRGWTSGWLSDGFVNGAIGLLCQVSFQMRWEVAVAEWFFGLDRPTDTLREMKKYSLRLANGGSFLDRVKCPVLVSGSANSLYFDADAHTVEISNQLSHLTENQKTVWIPKAPGDGGLQAKMGALQVCNEHTFAFLDEHLGIKRDAL